MIFFFDLDGTLIDCPHGISEPTDSSINALKQLKQNGHQVFISTGRGYSLLPSRLSEVELDGFIVSNGTEIYIQHECVYQYCIPQTLLDKIIAAQQNGELDYFLESSNTIVVSRKDGAIKKYAEKYHLPLDTFHLEISEPIVKACIVFYSEQSDISKYNNFDANFKLVQNDPVGYDFNLETINKGSGVKYIMKKYNLKKEDCIAFGDGYNDVEMFDEVGMSVAMGDASKEVALRASHNTCNVVEEGVFTFLKKLGYID